MKSEHDKAKNAALRLLTAQARSSSELTDRLTRRGFEQPIVESVIADLTGAGLLDDDQFAADLADQELARSPAGSALLELKLRRKGISSDIARETIREALSGRDESADALQVARRHLKTLPETLAIEAVTRRLLGKLSRRGFGYAVAFAAVEEVVGEISTP